MLNFIFVTFPIGICQPNPISISDDDEENVSKLNEFFHFRLYDNQTVLFFSGHKISLSLYTNIDTCTSCLRIVYAADVAGGMYCVIIHCTSQRQWTWIRKRNEYIVLTHFIYIRMNANCSILLHLCISLCLYVEVDRYLYTMNSNPQLVFFLPLHKHIHRCFVPRFVFSSFERYLPCIYTITTCIIHTIYSIWTQNYNYYYTIFI